MTEPPEGGRGPVPIGWKEYLDLPDLGLWRLKTKIDTGARTSALHVGWLEVAAERPDGSAEVAFAVSPDRHDPSRQVEARARMVRRLKVVDSGGHPEVRPLIETTLVLGPVEKRILLTLTDRTGMLFRMILGRKALEGDFRVDVSGKYLFRRSHRRRRSETRG